MYQKSAVVLQQLVSMAQLVKASDCYAIAVQSGDRQFEPAWGRILFLSLLFYRPCAPPTPSHFLQESLSLNFPLLAPARLFGALLESGQQFVLSCCGGQQRDRQQSSLRLCIVIQVDMRYYVLDIITGHTRKF